MTARTLPETKELIAAVDELSAAMVDALIHNKYRDNKLPDDLGWITQQCIVQLGYLVSHKHDVYREPARVLKTAAHVCNYVMMMALAGGGLDKKIEPTNGQ